MITKEIEIKQFIRRFLACGDDPIADAKEISAKKPRKAKEHTNTYTHVNIS